MELLLSFILMLWGAAQEQPGGPEPNWEQVVQAVAAARESVDGPEPEPIFDEKAGTPEWIKRDPQKETAPTVRGVYVSAHSANGSRMQDLLKLIDETALNAMVIDIKEDHGYVTFETGNPEIDKFGSSKPIIRDIDKIMETLDQHDIYPIARIVVFKDTVLANKKPEWSFLNPDGTVWTNNRKPPESFVNPYIEEIWKYNVEVAKEAVKAGFKEIQFDYVRFPEGFERRADILKYTRNPDKTRVEAVTDFVEYARKELNPLGVRVSVDIFGYSASVPAAEGIGQDFNAISRYVDVICPMVYPSHYSTGWFGSRVPDARPYTTIFGAMIDTHKKLEEIKEIKPVIRPWIQDFTASWVDGYIPYGKHEVEEQIRALHDTGIDEFLLWNSGNRVYGKRRLPAGPTGQGIRSFRCRIAAIVRTGSLPALNQR